jgi:hypothetical protein
MECIKTKIKNKSNLCEVKMKKILSIMLVAIMMSSIMLSSCTKGNNDKEVKIELKENNDVIQIWYYDYEGLSNILGGILLEIKEFCKKEDIPLEVIKYSDKDITHNDYILKRNLALTSGNVIVLEDARYMLDIAKNHSDYTKLDSYDKLLSAYKDRFCIPLVLGHNAIGVENEVINYYGIDTDEKPLITYNEYLELKQEMKKKGAKFEQSNKEFFEIIDYYSNLNGLLYLNFESDILKDNSKLKEMLKKTVLGVCNDVILYNDGKLDFYNEKSGLSKNMYIYDKNSKLSLRSDYKEIYGLTFLEKIYEYQGDRSKKTFVIYPRFFTISPCFYMHEKITNGKIYKLANFIVSDLTCQKIIKSNRRIYSPVFNTDDIKTLLSVDSNWDYKKKESERDKKFIDITLDTFIKDDKKSKQIIDEYFSDYKIGRDLAQLVNVIVYNVSNYLSNGEFNDDFTLENFDSNDIEINKIIDKEIDEFITNFNVHNN